jgi:serine/threonine protein kinase
MSDQPDGRPPGGPYNPVPADGTTQANPASSIWQPTVANAPALETGELATYAVPTDPAWVNIRALKPLGPGDPHEIGGYRLRALLGEGGMGKVYLSNTPGGRPVAIKVVRTEYSHDPSFRRRFEQEVSTAQRVQGIYTAPVIDAGPHAPQPWLATAYVAGPSLQFAIGAYGPLPTETVLVLVAGVAEALQSIHAVGVVHRDLKPSNVILAADGPRVIDFGIARAVDSTSVTRTGVRPGTPAYMSPEHVRGEPVSPAADVWALGVLANFAATGELAFGGGMDPAVPYRIMEQEPTVDSCAEPVRGIVLRCLHKDPQQRPDPAEIMRLCREASTGTRLQMGQSWLPPQVAAEVNRIAAEPMPPTPPPIQPIQPTLPAKRRRPLVASLAVIGVVLALAAAVGLTAYFSGAFDKTNQTTGSPNAAGQTNEQPPPETATENKPTSRSQPTTSAGKASSVPRVGSGPGSLLGKFDSINLPAGHGIAFDQPTRVIESSSTDLYYYQYSGLSYDGKAIILDAGAPATYEGCTSDTRYVTNSSAITELPAGAAFCLLNSGRVALIEIKKVPDTQAASQYYEIAITLWQAPTS